MAIYKKIKLNAFNADLAQLVEQLNRNQKVEGSSPLIGTIEVKSRTLAITI